MPLQPCSSASVRPLNRLQLSLIETRRCDGKVRHEHIASLGSSVAERIAFWTRLHERLAKLANRVDAATQTGGNGHRRRTTRLTAC